jgi:uncharacterized protein YkwD
MAWAAVASGQEAIGEHDVERRRRPAGGQEGVDAGVAVRHARHGKAAAAQVARQQLGEIVVVFDQQQPHVLEAIIGVMVRARLLAALALPGLVLPGLVACAGLPGDPPRGDPPDDEVLGELEQALVDAHNSARARVEPAASPPLGEVTWDADIASVAQAWAERCVFEHSDGTGYGENLALFSPRDIDAALATATVELWESEAVDYDYDADSCAFGRQCGHYTQVVWRDTARIGCGIASCDDVPDFGPGIMFVCNYDPPGNFIGERPY